MTSPTEHTGYGYPGFGSYPEIDPTSLPVQNNPSHTQNMAYQGNVLSNDNDGNHDYRGLKHALMYPIEYTGLANPSTGLVGLNPFLGNNDGNCDHCGLKRALMYRAFQRPTLSCLALSRVLVTTVMIIIRDYRMR